MSFIWMAITWPFSFFGSSAGLIPLRDFVSFILHNVMQNVSRFSKPTQGVVLGRSVAISGDYAIAGAPRLTNKGALYISARDCCGSWLRS
ncbi:hypothetical protein ACWKW6_15390 [Dyadobacter jiangsuensis]